MTWSTPTYAIYYLHYIVKTFYVTSTVLYAYLISPLQFLRKSTSSARVCRMSMLHLIHIENVSRCSLQKEGNSAYPESYVPLATPIQFFSIAM